MGGVSNWIEKRPVWVIELDSYRLAGTREDGVLYGKTKREIQQHIRDRGLRGEPVKVWVKYERVSR